MKKFLFLIFAFLIIHVSISAESVDLAPNATSAIIIEASTGTVIYNKNEHEKLAPASMTKMMGLLLIMEQIEKGNLKWDEMITASANASAMGGSQIFLERIFDYEKSVFHIDDNTAVLLNNKINFDGFINLLSETEEAPKNLQWLKYLKSNENITKIRYEKALKYPVEKLVIVEGATEETLLPVFAAKCGCDFDKNGVYVHSAGGKNQVVKSYYSFAEKLKIPIFVLLDKDAKQNQEYIEHKLRTQDVIHLLSCGEFEDLLPLQLIKRTLEYELSNISILEQDMLISDEPMVKRLEEIFKTRGMHEFKKVEFAQMVSRNILQDTDISEEIREIIHGIRDLK